MFRLSVTFKTVKDRLKDIRRSVRLLDNAQAIVGWEGSESYPGTQLTVAQVAVFNEYGTQRSNGAPGVPARPFMRQAYQRNLPAIIANRNEAYRGIVSGDVAPEKALMMMGYRFQEMVRREIIKGDFQPNAASTVGRKKVKGQGGRPLIASKRMLNAIRTRVEFHGKDLTRNASRQDAQATTRNQAVAAQQGKAQERFKTAKDAKSLRETTRKEVREAKQRKVETERRTNRRAAKQLKVLEKRERLAAKKQKRTRDKIDKRNLRNDRDKRRANARFAFKRLRARQ